MALIFAGLCLSIPYIMLPLHSSRLTTGSFVFTMVAFVAVGRVACALLLTQPTFRRRALVVGAGWAGRTVVDAVQTHASAEYELVGYIDDDPAKEGALANGLPVLGTRRDLAKIVSDRGISEIVAARSHGRLWPRAPRGLPSLRVCGRSGPLCSTPTICEEPLAYPAV